MTHFVSSMGTTGTIMGVSRFLKGRNPAVQIVGLQPGDGAQIAGEPPPPPLLRNCRRPGFLFPQRAERRR